MKLEPTKLDEQIKIKITKNITVKTSKYRLCISSAFTIALFVIVLLNTKEILNAPIPKTKILYGTCLLGSLLSGALAAFEYNIPEKLAKWITRSCFLLLPVGTMAMAECLNGVYIADWSPASKLLNCLFYTILFLAAFALSGSRRAPFFIINSLVYILALTNHFVTDFRGTPFLPIDFLYIKTAASVIGSYKFSWNYQIITSTILMILMMAISWKIKTPKQKLWKRIYYRTIAGICALTILGGYYFTDIAVKAGISAPFFFDQSRGYNTYGVTLSFFMNSKYLNVKRPPEYTPEGIEKIMYEMVDTENDSKDTIDTTKETPNIICIMNESLADLSILEEIKTNKDYMPFLHNLTENTVKGNLYTSVIGGGTSNTEFEFLTGATTAFLPANSTPYSLYVNRNLDNLTTTLTAQNYSATAFHPYYKKNWNRIAAYQHLGFKEFIGLEDMLNKLESIYQDEGVLLRGFISDTYDYDTVIEMQKEKDENIPLFVFNVTMQNHGGYTNPYENFEEEIYLVNEQGEKRTDFPEINQYLSLIYESDKAVEKLLQYYSQQEEPTIICIFGDHQPSLPNEFIDQMQKSDNTGKKTLEQTQSLYVTPFYIWANYDIEEKLIERLSANYLSSYLMKIAGIQMPLFNQYLLKLSETLPVINATGYIDANNIYYNYGEETQYSDLLDDYEKICYNFLFDEEHYCREVFQLSP